jgi:CubicO group peptidase (beta-lactamase class C family)
VLALDNPVSHYVPELAATGYAGATLGQVLDMRSGVRFVEDYLDPASEVGMLDRVAGWKPPLPGEVLGGIYDFILTLKQERPHGGAFAYRSIETDVLGWVLERATGRGLADLLSRELWQSLGCEADASMAIDRSGTCQADGGLSAGRSCRRPGWRPAGPATARPSPRIMPIASPLSPIRPIAGSGGSWTARPAGMPPSASSGR